jgi:hypothetical protein
VAEQLANFGNTTLAEDLDNSETTVTVTSGSVFPSSGNFRINIDDEIMLVTSRSTNDLTVTRGAESTVAATHNNGATVKQVLTAAGLNTAIDERGQTSLYEDTTVGTETWGIDRANGATQFLTLTGNPTFTLAGAFTDRATDIRLILKQDGTGGRTVTWPGTITWATGSAPVLYSAAAGTDIVGLVSVDDGTSWLGFHTLPFVGAKAYNSSDVALTLNSEEYDTHALHSTSSATSRMTIPTGLGGTYVLHGGSFSSSSIGIYFKKNGNTLIRGGRDASKQFYQSISAVTQLVAGDYVELFGAENATYGHASILDAQTTLAIAKIG